MGKEATGRRRHSKLLDVATANSLTRKKLQKGFLRKWLVVRYNGLDHEEVGILNETSS